MATPLEETVEHLEKWEKRYGICDFNEYIVSKDIGFILICDGSISYQYIYISVYKYLINMNNVQGQQGRSQQHTKIGR